LHGYGDIDFEDNIPFEEQQRSLILTNLANLLNSKMSLVFCEIGCGNGDVIAHLATKYPHHKFIGMDFFIKNALAKHNEPNCKFIKGYALDVLQNTKGKIDVVFCSSTSCLFNPKELESYINLFSRKSIKHILISEPTFGEFEFSGVICDFTSYHLEGALWLHDYKSYFSKNGYRILKSNLQPYQHSLSNRPDIRLYLGHFEKP
jgi:SAM-dependent methyltransferase